MKHKIWINFIAVLALVLGSGGIVRGEELMAQAATTEARLHTGSTDLLATRAERSADTADAVNVEYIGHSGAPAYAVDVAVAGNYAYVADNWQGGLHVINVSDPAAPIDYGFYDSPGFTWGVAVAGKYVYLADGLDGGLRVIDVSDPAAPSESGYYVTPGDGLGVAVSGNYAYVADGTGGLRVIDVSDPANPIEVGFYDTADIAYDVAVAGNYAYVADAWEGLRIIDVSDPVAPTETGFYITPGAHGVATDGDYVYVADWSGGLYIIDVSDPANPIELGNRPGGGSAVAVAEGHAYVAAGSGGLRVIDISDPAAPIEAGFYDTPDNVSGNAIGVAVANNLAYLADGEGGLIILKYTARAETRIFLPGILRDYCPDFFDDFGNPGSGWEIGDDEFVRYEYLNGEYRVLTKNDQYIYLFAAPTCARDSYVVEVDARWVGAPGASYGIVFGIVGDYEQYYTFEVNTDYQDFGLWRFDGKDYHTIVPITPSWAINSGTATNRLRVTRNGSQITLQINGVTLGTWIDGNIAGKTGAGILSVPYDGEPISDARFDNFSVTRLNAGALATETTVVAPVPAKNIRTPETYGKFEPVEKER